MASHPEVTASLLGSLGSDRPTPYLPRRNDVLWYLLVASTILAVVAFRLVYLVWLCPFDLAPDEAHYWDWSRQLDWCYYSKGPMVAWLIRAAEATCGAWLRDTHGTTMPAVRLPAVVCGGFFALGVFVFTYQLSASLSLAYFTMLAILLTPHFTALSTLITIDSPFLCFWQWSLVAAYRAILPDCSWDTSNNCGPAVPTLTDPRKNCRTSAWLSWWILGSFIGLGILAKPTMVLFPACLVLFLTGYRPARHHFRSSRFWLMMMVAGILGAGPILWWNAHHDWVTFRHVLTQATLTSSGRWRPWGWLEYLGVQCALLFGAGFLLWLLASRWAARVCRSQDVSPHTRATAGFLLCFSWPVFLLFAGFSLRTSIQPNWPVAAYLAAIPLVALWLHRRPTFRSETSPAIDAPVLPSFINHFTKSASFGASVGSGWLGFPRNAWAILLWPCAAFAFLVNIFLHQPRWAYELGILPTLARLTGHADDPNWPRRFDPTCRLQGWREIARAVQQLRESCRTLGWEPILAATPYGTAAELAFYLPDQPRVFCLNRPNGLRYTQYDLYRPNPVNDPQAFMGRDFICVGVMTESAQRGFAAVQLVRTVSVQRYGYEIAREWIFLASGYRGFPAVQPTARY